MSVSTASAGFSPLNPQARSLAWKAAAVVLGTLLLTASSYVSVPMYPVPITMQTFAICMVGALLGWRLGGLTVMAWLTQAAVGLPVLANGAGGLAHFAGPTGGYLAAFPVMAVFVGWLAERSWNGRKPMLAFTSMLIANAFCLVAGGAWLAGFTGFEKALALGVSPFIIGGVLKSGLGAAILAVAAKRQAA